MMKEQNNLLQRYKKAMDFPAKRIGLGSIDFSETIYTRLAYTNTVSPPSA